MASILKLIMAVAMAALASKYQKCEAYGVFNASIQRQPQKTVEIFEVLQPRHGGISDRTSDSQRRTHSQEEQKYEVFTKPNKNARPAAGGQKIKTFVESEYYNDENQFPKNSPASDDYRPIPLTIKTEGRNLDTFQQKNTDKENSDRNEKSVVSASRQVHESANASFSVQKSNMKTVHTLSDIPKEIGIYGEDRSSLQSEDREKRNKYGTNVEVGSVLKERRAEELHSSYTPGNNYRNSQTSGSYPQNERSGNSSQAGVPERNFRETSSETQQSYNRRVSVDKVLVFEPNTGISASQVSPAYPVYSHVQSQRPAHESDYKETRTSSARRVSNTEEQRRDEIFGGTRTRTPGRNSEDSPIYDDSSNKRSSVDGYSRNVATQNAPNGRGRSDGTYSPDTKTYYNTEEKQPYNQETDVLSSTGFPYETVPVREQIGQGKRPVRQNTEYGGFPESFTANSEGSSRPSVVAGSNPFPASPCPAVFRYTLSEDDRWYGDIYVSTEEFLTGMRLDIVLNKPADLMTAVSTEVKSQDNIRFTALSLKKRLIPGSPETVKIMVKYNSEQSAPFLLTIALNGRMICPSRISTTPNTTTKRPVYVFPGDLAEQKRTTERPYSRPIVVNEYTSTTRRTTSRPSFSTKRTTPPTDYIPDANPDSYEGSDYNNYNRPTSTKPVPNRPSYLNSKPSGQTDNRRPPTGTHGINLENNNANGNQNHRPNDQEKKRVPCGMPAVQPRPLITNGRMTMRGQWPWHAALYKSDGPNLNYSCGGTLVTDLHVITAAHCVTTEHSVPLNSKMLLVYLGKYHLHVWTEHGIANRQVSRVTVHPNYNGTDFRSDIAVLTLSSKVDFTDFIRPVCLWDKRNTGLEDIVALEGTVIGWGYDETKHLTEELKQAKMPVVSHNDCLWSYPEFYPKFTSNTTYCAGFKNGTSVCNGDSGGGMFFPIKVNREERWFLRGLVSLSPGEKNTKVCDTKHYAVFTDVAKYLPWLEDVLS